MQVTPFGACGTVTGSCHMVHDDTTRLVLDCGMYQGEMEPQNRAGFGFDAREVTATLITHAHLDHIGRLPRLVREGFAGRVLATPATLELIDPMLEDSLKIMAEDNRRAKRKGHEAEPPLWEARDLDRLRELLTPLRYYQRFRVGSFTVELKNAGHLPGSAFVEVERDDGARVVYSGDLGNRRKEVLPDLDYASPADLVLTESTYGDRNHKPLQATLEEFARLVSEVLVAGGKVIIPSFALERTQELLFYIRELESEGRIPIEPVFVDSPLAIEVTRLYERLQSQFDLQVRTLFDRGIDPFRPERLTFTRAAAESRRLNDLPGPATIIAGSGMFTGGRILHHLIHHIGDERSCVVIVGYQPRGGLGRRLIDGHPTVDIWGRPYPVRARIATIGGFSAHAGHDQLLDWLRDQPRVALVHGEDHARARLGADLEARGQAVVHAERGRPITV